MSGPFLQREVQENAWRGAFNVFNAGLYVFMFCFLMPDTRVSIVPIFQVYR